MSGVWNGTLAARDDVRHTYEQVFFGRQLTGDVAPIDAANSPAEATPPGVTEQPMHDHAEVYQGIWGETLPPEPDAGGIHGAPQLEPPTIEPATPSQGNDQVPGY